MFYPDSFEIAGHKISPPLVLSPMAGVTDSPFRRIIESGTAQIVQPNLMYFGGFCRSIKVARMAEAAGLEATPHMSGGDLGYLYVAHYASVVPNAGPHQEFKDQDETLPVACDSSSLKSVNGMLKVPTGAGLGVTIDPAFIRNAKAVSG